MILLVEDEASITEPLTAALAREGWATHVTPSAKDAPGLVDSVSPDLVLLDVMLEDGSGFDVCREIRQKSRVPIIMLTARGEETDRIRGLDTGADDYLTKPFHPEELQLRIQALLRRVRGLANQPKLEAAGLHLDEGRQCVSRGEEDIQLTAAEFRLLRYFMLHPGQILSKSHLAEHLYDGENERDSNVIEVHVNHLRRKLGRAVVETRRGQGYRFAGTGE